MPRHLFVPEAPLPEAYGLGVVVTHWDGQGVPTSLFWRGLITLLAGYGAGAVKSMVSSTFQV